MKRSLAASNNTSFSPPSLNNPISPAVEPSPIKHPPKQHQQQRRGRPVGARNKPKPPVIITCDPSPRSAFRTHVLEIPSGRDAVKALAAFAANLAGDGLCVLAGYGSVSSVTIQRPSQSPDAVIFRGCFDLVSLSAVFLPGGGCSMTASLTGTQGQVMGVVVGPLVAAGKMMVVAAAFTAPEFHRLPEKEGEDDSGSCSGSLSGGGGGGVVEKGSEMRGMYFQGIHMRADDEEGAAGVLVGGGGGMFGNDGGWIPAATPADY